MRWASKLLGLLKRMPHTQVVRPLLPLLLPVLAPPVVASVSAELLVLLLVLMLPRLDARLTTAAGARRCSAGSMDSSGRPWIMEVSCCLAASISGVRPGDTWARGVLGAVGWARGEGSLTSSFMTTSLPSLGLEEVPGCSLFTALVVPAVEAEAAAVPALGCEGEGGEDPPGEGEREGEPRPSLSPADTLSLSERLLTVVSMASFRSLSTGLVAPAVDSPPPASAVAPLSDWLDTGDDVTPSPVADWSECGDVIKSLGEASSLLSQSSSPSQRESVAPRELVEKCEISGGARRQRRSGTEAA